MLGVSAEADTCAVDPKTNFLTCTGKRVCESNAFTAIALERHGGGGGSAVAIAVGVGVGVGVPVGLLLLFLCCVLPLVLLPFLLCVSHPLLKP